MTYSRPHNYIVCVLSTIICISAFGIGEARAASAPGGAIAKISSAAPSPRARSAISPQLIFRLTRILKPLNRLFNRFGSHIHFLFQKYNKYHNRARKIFRRYCGAFHICWLGRIL